MKLLQLYYFKALAEREHLTATAAELYISPPSLSAAISRLETDLGVPLFDRVGRNIRLNDKGRQFYDHVKLALDELDKGFDELQSTAAWNRNLSLRVATSTHIIWEKPFADYICKHPHVAFSHRSLSLDQLLSGGLVSSRAMTGENPVTLSSGETLVEAELLTAVIDLLAADENNRIWLLDTVMRLAATTGYGGIGLNENKALRTYAKAPRPHLEGTDLTIGNIVADYPLGADGTPVPVEAEEPLPEGAVENYLASRERKLRLSDAMFQALEETADGQFRVLIGIDDSSEEDSIQKNEIAYLRAQLRQGDALLSGVDDLAFKAVTKLCLEEYGWEGATVSVQYFGGTEDQPACAYDYQPLEAIVAEHFDFFDLTMAEPGGEELAMLVLTQPADPAAQET